MKVFARIYTICPQIKSKYCISLETLQTVWKVSALSEKSLDSLERFQTILLMPQTSVNK